MATLLLTRWDDFCCMVSLADAVAHAVTQLPEDGRSCSACWSIELRCSRCFLDTWKPLAHGPYPSSQARSSSRFLKKYRHCFCQDDIQESDSLASHGLCWSSRSRAGQRSSSAMAFKSTCSQLIAGKQDRWSRTCRSTPLDHLWQVVSQKLAKQVTEIVYCFS